MTYLVKVFYHTLMVIEKPDDYLNHVVLLPSISSAHPAVPETWTVLG